MGKRKAAKRQAPKKKLEPLSSTFKCLFCNHEKAVSVKLNKQTMFGQLECKICGMNFQTPINNLSAAVDVYYDWVDACEDAKARQPPKKQPVRGPAPTESMPVGLDFESRRRLAGNKEHDDADGEGEEDDADQEQDRDGEGEADDDDEVDDADDVPTRGDKDRRAALPDDEDEEDDADDVDDADNRGDKRRRVAAADPDDEESD